MENIPKYNRDKYYRIMDRTQSNYGYQWKRLSKESKRADFILIYYSLSIIVYSLSVKFYPHFFSETWSSYSSLILSAIVLIYSIINSKAGYTDRINKIQNALNEVKRLKREVGALPQKAPYGDFGDSNMADKNEESRPEECQKPCGYESGCDMYSSCQSNAVCPKLEKLKKEYDELVSNTEMRDDLDFYYTILHLCKQHNLKPSNGEFKKNTTGDETDPEIKEIRGYISENNPRVQRLHIIFLYIWHFGLYITPIIIFAVGLHPLFARVF